MRTYPLTIYDAIKPSSKWAEIPLLMSFNLLLVLSSYVAIELPFSPVPITGQTFGVLLMAMALGRIRGTAVVMAYLLEGLAGFPVFAEGRMGLTVLFGPTGGYLIGFAAAAYVTGHLAERGWHRSIFTAVGAMLAGGVVIYACGLAWLSRFVPSSSVLATGLVPFLPGEAIKMAVASCVLPGVWRLTGLYRR